MDITIVTSTTNDGEALELLKIDGHAFCRSEVKLYG